MGLETKISWTDHTFNIAWGCVKVSDGCKNCYADNLAVRYGFTVWGPKAKRRTFGEKHWNEPRNWNAAAERDGVRRRVFCSSMCDVFEDHPTIDAERAKLWPLIRECPWLDWQILTKRAARIASQLPDDWGDGYPNVWLGTSVESNSATEVVDGRRRMVIERIADLRRVPARLRFISYEPAIGPLAPVDLSGIHWLIYGGESGKDRREHDPQWARDIRAECERQGVAFFYKQSSAYKSETQITLDGKIIRAMPEKVALPRDQPAPGGGLLAG